MFYIPIIWIAIILIIGLFAIWIGNFRIMFWIPLVMAVWFIGSSFIAFANMPVTRWGSVEKSADGSIVTFYEHASPTYWDKWTNSAAWQEYEEWLQEKE